MTIQGHVWHEPNELHAYLVREADDRIVGRVTVGPGDWVYSGSGQRVTHPRYWCAVASAHDPCELGDYVTLEAAKCAVERAVARMCRWTQSPVPGGDVLSRVWRSECGDSVRLSVAASSRVEKNGGVCAKCGRQVNLILPPPPQAPLLRDLREGAW